ncbi:ABC transporter transmembrane domain-containing protein, partial [Rhizobiaceae sp. 2RAB30]
MTLAKALMSFRKAFTGVGLMTGVINILALTGSFFMLQVYDRVIPSKSLPTLVGLMLLTGTMFAFQGVLELIRSRLMVRLGAALDGQMSGQVYSALMRLPLRTKMNGDGLQPLRDLDQIRSFLSSAGPTALFDLPWMPHYIGICFLFHFWIGVTALAGAFILFGLTLLAEMLTKEPTKTAGQLAQGRQSLAEAT